MARRTYDDALPLCRPMYYDYPEAKEAYTNRNEYMFGDNILVYPITSKMQNDISTQSIWLPGGTDWYELSSGTLLKGGQTTTRQFQLDEYPVYVKAGSILPEYNKVWNLKHNDEPITITVYPGKPSSSFSMYEDNGNDKNYATQYATTLLSKDNINDSTVVVTIGSRQGSYEGMPQQRHFSLKLVASAIPNRIVVDGRESAYSYDGNSLSLIIDIPQTDCSKVKKVEIYYPKDAMSVTDGLIGKFRHIQQGCIAAKSKTPGIVFKDELGTMESTGVALGYYPNDFNSIIQKFRTNYSNLKEALSKSGIEGKEAEDFIRKAY